MNQPTHISRYEVKRAIGQGGMARVYLAHDPHFNRDVAIKVLTQRSMGNALIEQKFVAEAKLIAGLEHNAIVPVYDYGTHDEQPFLVMRLMTGKTLEDRLRQGALTLEQIELVLRRICSALDKAHSKHIVHRDLKPANILFDDGGMPYLADFGIARLTDATQTTTVIGTPSYMAPEQALGQPLDARTDVYQMGVVLFEMLTGQVPFKGEISTAVVYQHVHEPVPDLRQFSSQIPFYYQQVVEAAMAKQPFQRPATAGALYERFKNAPYTQTAIYEPTVAGATYEPTEVLSQAEQKPSEAAPASRNNLLIFGGVGALLLLLVLFLGVGAWWLGQSSEESDAVALFAPSATETHMVTAVSLIATERDTPTPTVPPTLVAEEKNVEENTAVAEQPDPAPTSTILIEPTLPPTESIPPTAPPILTNNLGGGSGQMAFAANNNGNYDIFVAPLDDPRRLVQLTSHIANDFGPRYSPDGSKIAFHTYRDNNWEVYVMNSNGTGLSNLTRHGRDDTFASWSPDGSHLLFHSNRDGDFEIYRINVDGSGLQQITFNNVDDLNPAYSPDGSQIAFHRRMSGDYQLFIMNADGTVARQITNEPYHHEAARWSPDGTQLVYMGNPGGVSTVFVMDVEGGSSRRLSPSGVESFYPEWSLDGEWVAFHGRVPNSENREIYIVNVQTGEERIIPNTNDVEERMPAWQP